MAGVWALLNQSLLFASHDCHPHSCTTPGVLSRAQIASSHTVEQEALARPECTLQPWQRPSARHSQSDYRKREPPQQPYLGSVRFLSEFHPWKYLLGVKPPRGQGWWESCHFCFPSLLCTCPHLRDHDVSFTPPFLRPALGQFTSAASRMSCASVTSSGPSVRPSVRPILHQGL